MFARTFARERVVPWEGLEGIQAYLAESLNRIKKNSNKKLADLHAATDAALVELQKEILADQVQADIRTKIHIFFEPFRLTCDTKNVKTCSYALDCIEKLLEHGFLRPNPADPGETSKLIDQAVACVSDCFTVDDDYVQLQIVQALEVGVKAQHSEVHEGSLLTAVRTIYNIYLNPKSVDNAEKALEALQVILKVVYKRMETASVEEAMNALDATRSDASSQAADVSPPVESGEAADPAEVVVEMALEQIAPPPIGDVDPEPEPEAGEPVALPRRSSVVALEERLGDSSVAEADDDSADTAGATFPNIYQKDGYLLFRALCKLSMKQVTRDQLPDSVPVRSKLQALTLIQSVLETAGPAFRSGEKFAYAIKQYLCLSLLKNCVSPFDSVFTISIAIFDNLVVNFVDHLKTELQVFFENIFFRFLENPMSSYMHKSVVLESVRSMCATVQFPVDVYLNYDCDFEGSNVFERLIKSLSDMARGHDLPAAVREGLVTVDQGQQLQLAALDALVTCVCSMVDWCKHCDGLHAAEAAAITIDEGAEDADDLDLEALIEKERGARGKVGKGEQAEMAEQQKRRKEMLVQAVVKFNLKPKTGVLFLQKCGLVPEGNGPDAVVKLAQIFRETEGFDMTELGNYMGEGGTPKTQFNVSVLHAFIDTYDFKEVTFSTALRTLLKGFRLPGEAQKIDRVVEKFAERFCGHNPGDFDNADVAYTLAYSVIMLNTDRHNPMVKKKMELPDFLRNNRGINGDGGDLPAEMLTTIFHEIVENEIKMKEDGEDWSKHSGMLTAKQRQQMWQDESDRIVRQSSNMFSKRSDTRKFNHANEKHHVSLMFKAAWCPLLAAFSVIMEECDDPQIIELVLRGFIAAVHIGSSFFMDVERDAFVSTLAKFTLLHTNGKQMKEKHVEAIKAVIAIANAEGDYLEESWGLIQRSISQLDQKHLLLDGARDDASFFAGAVATPNKRGQPEAVAGQPTQEQQEYLYALPLQDQIDRSDIDRIYSNSSNLNSEAVIHFVKHLVKVSAVELESAQPRVFSMQKIVETAAVNMDRVRIVWSQIWKILQAHFQKVGCHENQEIALFAIDNLRQLARTFLEKDELSGFDFQQEFLMPFEHIVAHSQSNKIREFVVCCLDQMIQSSAKNLKSGWKALLKVLVVAASDQDEMIVTLGFKISEAVMNEHFAEIKDIFGDMSNCIVAFGCNKTNTTVSIAAMRHLTNLSLKLTNGDVIPLPEPSADGEVWTTSHTKYWWPLLMGIANLVNDERTAVRSTALDKLFHILRKHGGTFSRELWELVFKGVLIPIFDNVRHAGEEDEGTDEWLQKTCFHALQQLVDLFVHFYSIVVFLLDDVLELLINCAEQDRENLARIGVACFTRLCVSSGECMSQEVWSKITDTYATLFENTAPKELLLRTDTMDDEAVQAQSEAAAAQEAATASAAEAAQVRAVYEHKMGELEQMAQDAGDIQDAAAAARKRAAAAAEAAAAEAAAAEGGSVGGAGGESAVLEAAAAEAEAAAEAQSSAKGVVQEEARRAAEQLTTLEATAEVREAEADDTREEVARLESEREHQLRFRGVRCKCVVQLLLIDSVEEVFFRHGHLLRANQIMALLDALTRCHEFARNFNADIELRNELWSQGFMKKVPNLLKQAGNGIGCALRVLFRLYAAPDALEEAPGVAELGAEVLPPDEIEARQDLAEGRLVSLCLEVITFYLSLALAPPTGPPGWDGGSPGPHGAVPASEAAKEVESYNPIIVVLLQNLHRLSPPGKFAKHLPTFYLLLVELMKVGSLDVRKAVGAIFSDCVTPLLFPATQQQAAAAGGVVLAMEPGATPRELPELLAPPPPPVIAPTDGAPPGPPPPRG